MSALLEAFERGVLDPADFTHARHIEAAHALLSRTDFLDAAQRYMRGIRTLAANAGAAERVNLTVTLAFLSGIAERMEGEDAGVFLARHPELQRKDFLTRWYTPERLAAPKARSILLLP